MNKIIEKIIVKIREITNSSEEDAQKILVGLTILGIAISWFIMGDILSGGSSSDLSKIEKKESIEVGKMAEEASRDFRNK